MTTTILGGHGLGLLDSSTNLLNRSDRSGAGRLGHGEEPYVNVSNGDLVIQQHDTILPSRGADFDLVRTYNSRGYLTSVLGRDWSFSTGVTLISHQDKLASNGAAVTNYTATYGDGTEVHFSFDATRNLWVSTDGNGAYETLSVLASAAADGAKYVLTRADQTQFRFDNNFVLLSNVDTNGVRMDYLYQGGKLQQVRDDTGHVITFNYNGLGNLDSITDETGVTLVRYGYTQGTLTSVTDRYGHVTTYAYDAQNGVLSSITLPNQQVVNGQVQTYDTRQMSFSYERINWDDHPHFVTDFDKGFAYVIKSVSDALGGVTTFDYNFLFNTTTLDPSDRDLPFKVLGGRYFAGGTTSVVDALGNARATSDAAEYVAWRTSNGFYATYDAAAVAASTTLTAQFNAIRAGQTLTYTYDADGYITRVLDQQGYQTTYTYDAKDNLTSIVDRNGNAAVSSDAAYFRLLRQDLGFVDTAGNGKLVANLTAAEKTAILAKFTTSFTYDTRGNLLTRTDNAGNVTTWTYTSFNKVASELSATGNALATSNDAFYQQKRVELGFPGPLASLSAAQKTALRNLYTTTFSYDANQNLTQRTDAGGDITRFTYDAFGNLTQRTVFLDPADLVTPAKQQVTRYFYDAWGNNVETVDAEGAHTFRTFDHFGNVLTSIDGRGGVTTNTYDADNRLLSTTDPEGHVSVNAYDAVGNRISTTDAAGHTVSYVYDRNNLLIATIDPAATPAQSRSTTFTYDILGNRTKVTDAEGRTTTYSFDARRQLIQVSTPQVLNGAEALVSYSTTYAYDGESNLITRTDNNGNVVQHLYTTNGLLKRVTDAIGNVTEYLYDANLSQVQITIGAQLAPALRRVLKFSRDEENQTIEETDALGNRKRYVYDAPGNVVSVMDANGHQTDYAYDRNNRLIKETRPQVTDPVSGLPVRYTVLHQYDANGNEIATIDENGHVTSYAFDKDDRKVMVTDGNGIKTVYSWDSRDNQTQIAIGVDAHLDVNGRVVIDDVEQAAVTTFVYDEFNQLVSSTDAVGNALAGSNLTLYQAMRSALGFAADATSLSAVDRSNLFARYTERYTYDRVGNRTSVTDHLNRVSTVAYDALNRVQSRTEATGTPVQRTSSFRYDGNDNLVKLTDSLGRTTTFAYDANDRLTDETDALGSVTRLEYDHVGNITADIAAFGTPQARATRYIYDLNDRLTRELDPEGHARNYEYDAVGNRLKVIDGRGNATRYVYDALDRTIKVIDPLAFETRFEYDGVGNYITLIDARGGIERLQYDGGNRAIRTTDAMGRVTRFEYDRLGNAITQTTAFGLPEAQVTRFVYDTEGNLRQVTDALGNVSTQDFDQVYNLVSATDGNGHVTTSAFDALNRRIQVTDALGGVTQYNYDLEDNQLSETDPLGRVRSFQYDAKDRLIKQIDALGIETVYAYDAVDNQVSITRAANTAQASTVTFVYNKDDRLISQTDALGNTTFYGYDANHNVTGTHDALGRVTNYVYDANNQLITITDPLGHVTRYEYDGKGNRVRVTDARGNAETTYYNLDDEVILTVDALGHAVGRRYDGNGNVISTVEYMTPIAGPLDLATPPTPTSNSADRITTFAYDKLNRLITQTDALGGVNARTYDAVGNTLSETDENGHTTTYAYDALDRLITQTHPLGGVKRFAYDAVGNQLTQTDENGHVTRFAYDLEDRLVSETDPLGGVITYAYDAVDNRISQTDRNGHTTTFVYDLIDRLVSETDPLLGVKAYTYDAVGNQLSVTDENGNITQYVYDADDRLIRQTDAQGGVRATTYDAVDNVLTETDENGHVTRYAYDNIDRLITQTDPLGGVTRYSYDAVDNLLTETDPNGHVTTYAYDRNDRRVSETDALGGIKRYAYDAAGNEITVTDENGHVVTSTYDANDRLISVKDALDGVVAYTYDAVGNKLSETDENGHTTAFQYDANDRLVRQTNALGGIRTLTYDAAGNQLSETDEAGRTTAFSYDAKDRVITRTDALAGVSTFTYDAVGNRIKAVDEAGRETQFAFDGNDRLVRQVDALGGEQRFTYDAAGNRLTQVDENGRVTTSTYDANDRLISQTDPLNGVRRIEYDAAGNQVRQIDENGNATTFVFDANDRLIRQVDALGGARVFTYDAAGNQLSETDENGHTTRFAHDANDRVVTQTDVLGRERHFTYDAVGNQLTETDENGHAVTFVFDALDRLITETNALGGQQSFSYDAVGNLLTLRDENGNVTTYTYDDLDRRVSQTDPLAGVRTFEYDAVGNQTKATDELGRITRYEYDDNDRLVEQTDPLGGTRAFTYDAVGNRLSETDENGGITRFAYDDNDRLVSQTDALGGVRAFTYDAVGNQLTETDENGHTITSVYDANDRVVRVIDALGGERTYVYDAVGNELSVTDQNGHTTSTLYDAHDRAIRQTDGLGNTTHISYDHVGNVLTETDENGHVTTHAYDAIDRLIRRTDALGGERTYAYDAAGNRVGETDVNGNTTTSVYDANNRLVREVNALGDHRDYAYDAAGNRVSDSDENGHVTQFQYDANDRLIKQIDALGGIRLFAYDDVGNQISETDENGHTTTTEYDANHRLIKQTNPLGGVRSFTYDAVGNVLTQTDENLHTTTFAYDADDRKISQTDALGRIHHYIYDAVGNVVQVVNPLGDRLTQYYDADDRLVMTVDGAGVVLQTTYDATGNAITQILRAIAVTGPIAVDTPPSVTADARDQIIQMRYDALDHLVETEDAEGGITERRYDAVGNLLSVTDPNGHVTTYAYDENDRLTDETNALNQTKTFAYDAKGNTLRETDAAGKVTTYAYDANDRVVTQTDALGGVRQLAYDAVGNLITDEDETGRATTLTYDANDRLISEENNAGAAKQFGYDAAGNRITETDESGRTVTYAFNAVNVVISATDALGNTTSYRYDALDHPTEVEDADGATLTTTYDHRGQVIAETDALGNVTRYQLDTAGNRVRIIDPNGQAQTFYFDRNNRVVLMVDAEGFATSTTYDANGNILTVTVHAIALTGPLDPAVLPSVTPDAADRTTTYTWDALNRKTSTTDARGVTVNYAYDVAGNQILRSQGAPAAPASKLVTAFAAAAAPVSTTIHDYFDANHRRIASLTSEGVLTTYGYDASGREIRRTEYLARYTAPADGITPPTPLVADTGRVTTTTYDSAGRKDAETGPTGLVTRYVYDSAGREIERIEGFGSAAPRSFKSRYDLAGRLVETEDPIGTVTHYVLDGAGKISEKHEAFGLPEVRVTRYEYYANGRLKAEIDALNIRTEYEYNANGDLTKRITAAGDAGVERTEQFIYDSAGFLIEQINGAGERTTFEYDSAGNRTNITVAPGTAAQRVLTYHYDASNQLIEEIGGNGVMTRHVYDDAGNRIETIQAANQPGFERSTLFEYDTDNNLISVTDPKGGVVTYEYDAVGNRTRITDANGAITQNTYDALGRLTVSISGVGGPHGGIKIENSYDLFGNVIATTQSFADGTQSTTTRYAYDALDRQTVVTDGEGFSSEFTYDRFGNQTQIKRGTYRLLTTDPQYSADKAARVHVQTTDFVYDKLDHLIETTDGVGNKVTSTYDARGNRLTQTTAAGTARAATVTFHYDLADRVTRKDTPTGGRTVLEYDAAGNQTAIESLQRGSGAGEIVARTTFTYDGNGRVLQEIDPFNTVTVHEIDVYGNETGVVYAQGTADERAARTEYDANGHVSALVDALGNRTEYAVDAAGNRIKETDPLGRITHYYYDLYNQQIAELDPEGFLVTYTRDVDGNITQTRSYLNRYTAPADDLVAPVPGSGDPFRAVSSSFDAAGNLTSQTEADGIVKEFERDSTGLLITLTTQPTSDAARVARTGNLTPRVQHFEYDGAGKLTRFVNADGVEERYVYDAANNRIQETIHNTHTLAGGRTDPDRVTTFTYDLDNRQIGESFDNGGGVALTQSISYDFAGNVVSKTDFNHRTTVSDYDLNNRLILVTDPLLRQTRYAYDRIGNQIQITDARGNTTDIKYDAANRQIELKAPSVNVFTLAGNVPALPAGGNTNHRPTTTTVYDAVGNVIQVIDSNGNKTTSYYDGDNNKIAEVNGDFALRSFTYDATGAVTSITQYMTRLDALNPAVHDPDIRPTPPVGSATRVVSTAYDAASRATLTTYPQTEVTTLSGTNGNSPTATTALVTPTESSLYDAFGNLVESLDRNGARSFAYYDALGRQVASVDGAGYLTETSYDDQDNVVQQRRYRTPLNPANLSAATKPSVALTDADIVDRIYDAAGRLVEEISANVKVGESAGVDVFDRVHTTFTYDGNGNKTRQTIAAGTADAVTEYYYYDAANQQVAVVNGGRTFNVFTYDGNGNKTSQTRFINPVPGSVDLTSAGFSAIQAAVAPSLTQDETTVFSYDAMNRLINQSDLIFAAGESVNNTANDITTQTAYDPMGNVTRRTDALGFSSQLGYNAVGKITQTLSPNGAASFIDYDTGGLKVRSWTGGLPGTSAQQATNVTASVAGDLKISWNQPGTGAQSWVVWDTAPHSVASGGTPDQAYPRKSGVVGSGNVAANIPVNTLTAGTVVYFRVVSQDFAGNIAWTDEFDLTVPSRYDSLVVRESGADLQIDVHFVGAITNPVLKYGASNSALPNTLNFVSLGNGNYRTTLVAPSNPQSLAFQVQWVAGGATLTGSVTPFEASEAHVVIGAQIGIDIPQVNGANVGSSQIVVVDGLQDLESDTKQINARLNFDPEIGTTPGSHTYSIYWGNRVSSAHTVAVTNEDQQFTTVLSDTNTFDNGNPPAQTGRTQVLTWNHSYQSHILTTLSTAEAASISGSLNVAVKSASSSDQFPAPVAMTNVGSGSFSSTLNLAPGDYDLLISYTNTSRQQVIVEWRRLTVPSATLPANVSVTDSSAPFDFAGQSVTSGGVTDNSFPFVLSRTIAGTSPAAYTGASLVVTATERDGTITRAGNGNLSIDPGLYAGPHGADGAGVVLTVGNNSTSNGAGSKSSDGLTAQTYFTDIRYNALGQRIATNEDSGQWRSFGVDANGNVLVTRLYGTEQDEIAHLANISGHAPVLTYATYDARGRQLKSFGAAVAVAGQSGTQRAVTITAYDYADHVVSVLDPGNSVARLFQFDGTGNVIRETDALGHVVRRIYDRRGNATREINARNQSVTRQYDASDNMTVETNALGQSTRLGYDAFGRRITSTNPLNQIQRYAYDQHDRVVSATNAEGEVTRLYYDKMDRQLWLEDGNHHWFGTAYDSVGRPIHNYSFVGGSPADVNAANAALINGGALNDKLIVTTTEYDVFGNKITEIDGEGFRRSFSYGAFGRLISSSSEDITYTGDGAPPQAYSSTNSYDRFGRLVQETSTRGQNIVRTYDDAGRLTRIADNTTLISTDYVYDIAGRRARETIKFSFFGTTNLRNVTQTYNANGDLLRWSDAVTGKSLNYFYDAASNITQVRNDDSSVNHLYTYDAADQLTTFNQAGTVNTFSYDSAGRRTSWNDGSRIHSYTYDQAGRVTGETNNVDAAHKDWTYDDAGNITAYREFSDATTQSHYVLSSYHENNVAFLSDSDLVATTTTFDKAGRTLTQSVVDSKKSDDIKRYTYTYHYNPDATQKSVTATGSDDVGGNSTSTYNANGDLIRIDLGKGDGQDSAEFKTFTYNNDGQIMTRFHDDGDDDTANITTEFLYANSNPIGEVGSNGTLVLDDGNYDVVKIISEDFPEGSPTGYEVRSGDTLQSIATQIYGTPSLWFLIADANGLTGSENLQEGMRLQVPNTALNGSINADTHALYSESEIVGSKLPNLASPPPEDNKCKVIGAIILIVVVAIAAVALTIFTVGLAAPAAAAALGVAATSAAGIIIGVAVGAAIGAGIAFAASVITQGILIGFGLQKGFDWKQVAADTVAGAFGGAVGGLGKLVEVGLLAGKLARITVAVASAVLEAAGEAARQAIANDGHIDAPWAIALAGAGGAFGALTTRATRISRSVDKTGRTVLKVAKKAPAGTIIKGVKGKAISVFDAAGRRYVLKNANVKLVKTASGELRIVKRVGDTVPRVQKVRNAFLKTFGIGRTVSKADDGTKVIKTFELQKVSGRGRQAIFKEVQVEKTVTRNALTQGKSIKLSRGIKLKLVDGQITKVRRISNQYTRSQRISRFFSQKFNVGKFATRTLSKGDDGLKSVSRIELRPNAQIGGLLEEQRVTTNVTRTTLLKGKKLVVDDRIKLRLIDGQIQKVRRVSDSLSRTQRLQRALNLGQFRKGTTFLKTDTTKFVRTGTELKPIISGPLKGVLQERAVVSVVEREAIKAGRSVKLNDQVKLVKVGDKLEKVRRVSDQYSHLQRVQRRLGRAFNIGEFATKRSIAKSNSSGLKTVATLELRKSKTLPGVLEERVIKRVVQRDAVTKGKIALSDGTKLRLINGKVERVERISHQFTRFQRIQRRLGVGEFRRTISKTGGAQKTIRNGTELARINSGPLAGAFREQPLFKTVTRNSLLKGGSFKVDATTKKVLLNGKIVRVQRLSDQYSKAQRIQRRLGRLFNVGEFAESRTVSKPTANLKKVRTFELREIRGGGVNGQKLYREQAVTKVVRRLSSQGQSKRQLAAEATRRFFTTAATNFKIGAKKTGVFLSNVGEALTDFAAADVISKAGNRGSNLRSILGLVGGPLINGVGNSLLGTDRSYENHPPGPKAFLISTAVNFLKGSAEYAFSGGDSSDATDSSPQSKTYTESVGLPILNRVLNGKGERALRQLGYSLEREPIEVRARSVEPQAQFSVRDGMELYDDGHGRQHHWIAFDWVKAAAATTTQIFSPFTLDRGVGYAESLASNQLVAGQVAQYGHDTVQRFTAGSVGRVPDNSIPVVLLDNTAPGEPRVA